MRIIIVVDANVIMSALLGGRPSLILFDGRFQFVTAEFTLDEVEKYFSRLEKKTGISRDELKSLSDSLPLQIYKKEFYKDKLKETERIIGHIDKKDIEILALTFALQTFLWSEDRHFEKIAYPKLLKTYNFL